MRFVFTCYISTPQFTSPQDWLKRIDAYAGILEALAKTDEVISIEQIDFTGDVRQNGVQYLFRQFSELGLLFPHKLHSLIKAQKPDVVVVHGLHFPLQVIQLRRALGPGVKIILQNHAEIPSNKVRKWLQLIADRGVDAYLFASRNMGLNWVKRGNLADARKIHEVMEVSSIFYPIKKSEAQAQINVGGSPVFLWVGHLNKNKDPLTVVQGFINFIAKQPDARLYMIYRNEDLLPQVKQLIATNNVHQNIILVGAIPHDDLLYWFNSADFVISGSHYEGSGTVVCEGMSCGCIPVISDIQSFRMISNDGKCGILFEPGNVTSLTAALEQTLTNDMQALQMAAIEYYTSTLSFTAIASCFSKIAGSL